jgi:hypothetical protein
MAMNIKRGTKGFLPRRTTATLSKVVSGLSLMILSMMLPVIFADQWSLALPITWMFWLVKNRTIHSKDSSYSASALNLLTNNPAS